jgi:V-type H+-transporting ATPase subunit a
MRREIQVRIDDLEMVLESSRERMCEVLSGIQANLKAWKVLVAKEKSIYHTMNMFNYDVGRQVQWRRRTGWSGPPGITDRHRSV